MTLLLKCKSDKKSQGKVFSSESKVFSKMVEEKREEYVCSKKILGLLYQSQRIRIFDCSILLRGLAIT